MRHTVRTWIAGAGLGLAVLATGINADAQPTAGDYIVPASVTGGSALLTVTPNGVITTMTTLGFRLSAATMAPNNRDVAVVGLSGSAFIAEVSPGGAVTTVGTLPVSITENIAYDQDGSYLVPLIGLSSIMIGKMDSTGTVTTIVPAPAIGNGKPRGMAVDIATGSYLVGEIPNLFSVRRDGTSSLVIGSVAINNSIDMISDARTGDAIISQQNSLVSVNLTLGTMTTIVGGFSGCFPGLAYDRARDAWVIGGSCATANANLIRVDRAGNATTITAIPFPLDVEVYGSRNVTAAADPTPGTTFALRFSEPGSAGANYVGAASFLRFPGLVLPIGTVDLAPDALFFLSQSVPALFPGFVGTLGANGSAPAGIVIPNGPLQGLRFYVSFVTFTGAGLQAIANTAGFTIQ